MNYETAVAHLKPILPTLGLSADLAPDLALYAVTASIERMAQRIASECADPSTMAKIIYARLSDALNAHCAIYDARGEPVVIGPVEPRTVAFRRGGGRWRVAWVTERGSVLTASGPGRVRTVHTGLTEQDEKKIREALTLPPERRAVQL